MQVNFGVMSRRPGQLRPSGALLRAGLLDEVRLHLVPVLMGEGTQLFAGERGELIPEGKPIAGAGVTHLRYRVAKPGRP